VVWVGFLCCFGFLGGLFWLGGCGFGVVGGEGLVFLGGGACWFFGLFFFLVEFLVGRVKKQAHTTLGKVLWAILATGEGALRSRDQYGLERRKALGDRMSRH